MTHDEKVIKLTKLANEVNESNEKLEKLLESQESSKSKMEEMLKCDSNDDNFAKDLAKVFLAEIFLGEQFKAFLPDYKDLRVNNTPANLLDNFEKYENYVDDIKDMIDNLATAQRTVDVLYTYYETNIKVQSPLVS